MKLFLFFSIETEDGETKEVIVPRLVLAKSKEEAAVTAFRTFMDQNPTASIDDFEVCDDDEFIEVGKEFLELALKQLTSD